VLAARREQKEDLSHRRRDGGHARRAREECLLCASVHPVISLEFDLIALVDEDDAGLRSDRTGPRNLTEDYPQKSPLLLAMTHLCTYMAHLHGSSSQTLYRTYVLISPTNKYIYAYTGIRFRVKRIQGIF
jgi:hypothetical protein